MSVNPGFGGQSFIEPSLPKKIEKIREHAVLGLELDIEVDGGEVCGANIFVAGSAIYKTDDYADTISKLRHEIG